MSAVVNRGFVPQTLVTTTVRTVTAVAGEKATKNAEAQGTTEIGNRNRTKQRSATSRASTVVTVQTAHPKSGHNDGANRDSCGRVQVTMTKRIYGNKPRSHYGHGTNRGTKMTQLLQTELSFADSPARNDDANRGTYGRQLATRDATCA
ncbi:hypothetical protein ACLKA6_013888 [Drosophila palustris]